MPGCVVALAKRSRRRAFYTNRLNSGQLGTVKSLLNNRCFFEIVFQSIYVRKVFCCLVYDMRPYDDTFGTNEPPSDFAKTHRVQSPRCFRVR